MHSNYYKSQDALLVFWPFNKDRTIIETLLFISTVDTVTNINVLCVPGGRRAALRAHVEGQLWSHPDGSRGGPGTHRAGVETGGPAPNALRPLLLEGLQGAARAQLWSADLVSLFESYLQCGADE